MGEEQFTIHNSQLTLLRRLFLLAARHSLQAASALAPQRRVIPLRGLFLLLARDSLQAASPHCFVRRFTIHNSQLRYFDSTIRNKILTYIKERILGGRFFLSPEHTEVCEEFKKEVQRQRRLLYIVNFLLRT